MEAYPAAALDWLMLTVAHPDSAFAAEARKRLNELRGNQLKKQAALLDEMTRWTKSLGGDRDHRIATFLRTVSISSNEPAFAAPLVAECAAFLAYNRSYPSEDDIQHALARQALLVDAQVAIYHFDKLLALYPDSPFRPDSLLSIANAQRKPQRAYERAAQTYNRLIEQYPDTAEAAQGYEALAGMYDEDMRDYPKALGTYEAIVAKYRDTPIVLRALNAMAAIYQNRTNQPAKAVDSYLKIADTFRGPEVVDALGKAGKIAQYTLHDWNQAIYINDRIVSHAPGSEDAAKAMFANAEITEENLKDPRQARALYERLIAARPGHPLAKEAQRRIAAMERR
jgi:tetratricopeptide (TPR) repeat protein